MIETKNYIKKRNIYNYSNYTRFSGKVETYDYEGHHTLQTMAKKIAEDLKFDEYCRINIENKTKYNKRKDDI